MKKLEMQLISSRWWSGVFIFRGLLIAARRFGKWRSRCKEWFIQWQVVGVSDKIQYISFSLGVSLSIILLENIFSGHNMLNACRLFRPITTSNVMWFDNSFKDGHFVWVSDWIVIRCCPGLTYSIGLADMVTNQKNTDLTWNYLENYKYLLLFNLINVSLFR